MLDARVWSDGDLLPLSAASCSPLAHGLHCGTGVFEGIRSYGTAQGPRVLRLTEHLQRMKQGADILGMPFSLETFYKSVISKMKTNNHNVFYVRPLAYYHSGGLSLDVDALRPRGVIATRQWKSHLGADASTKVVSLRTSGWRRTPATSLPPLKLCGNYVSSIIAKREAALAGAQVALFADDRGFVCERTSENVFVVRGGRVTAVEHPDALPGGTRDTVIALTNATGRPVTRAELLEADEIYLTRTSAELAAVSSFDGRDLVLVADGVTCSDLGECAFNNGGCAQRCANSVGSFSCACDDAYVLAADGRACNDVDECALNTDSCAQVREDTNGGFAGGCLAGYVLDADGRSCSDVDGCPLNTDGCVQLCTNTAGSFTCGCNAGFTPNPDGRTCDDVNEWLTNNGGCGSAASFTCTNNDSAWVTCTPRSSATATVTGSISGSEPTFVRTLSDCVSGSGSPVPFDKVTITSTSAASQVIEAEFTTLGNTTTCPFDSFLATYTSFNPASPRTTCLESDNDSGIDLTGPSGPNTPEASSLGACSPLDGTRAVTVPAGGSVTFVISVFSGSVVAGGWQLNLRSTTAGGTFTVGP
ncbi:MAG: hypothetical protein FJ137_02390 [Deltaproteobacteria bacterium]|nr:hypothetical protein [Deltaproteobacteria bacterium]